MLPNVNTDDGDVGYRSAVKIHIRLRSILQACGLVGGLDIQRRGSWLAVVTTSNFLFPLLYPNQPQPDPCTAAVLVLSSFFKASKDPKSALIASAKGPDVGTLDSSEPVGARFFQKSYVVSVTYTQIHKIRMGSTYRVVTAHQHLIVD